MNKAISLTLLLITTLINSEMLAMKEDRAALLEATLASLPVKANESIDTFEAIIINNSGQALLIAHEGDNPIILQPNQAHPVTFMPRKASEAILFSSSKGVNSLVKLARPAMNKIVVMLMFVQNKEYICIEEKTCSLPLNYLAVIADAKGLSRFVDRTGVENCYQAHVLPKDDWHPREIEQDDKFEHIKTESI